MEESLLEEQEVREVDLFEDEGDGQHHDDTLFFLANIIASIKRRLYFWNFPAEYPVHHRRELRRSTYSTLF